jgi:hypothetical protein
MNNRVSCLALGIGLLAGTLFAFGRTPSPTLVAQAPASAPPSGVLITEPPAPVAVPPSGVLETQPTVERRAVTTLPIKSAQKVQIAKRAAPVTMRRHVVHWRSGARREAIMRTTTIDQSIAATPSVVSAAAEQPRNDGIGYELFFPSSASEKRQNNFRQRRAR